MFIFRLLLRVSYILSFEHKFLEASKVNFGPSWAHSSARIVLAPSFCDNGLGFPGRKNGFAFHAAPTMMILME